MSNTLFKTATANVNNNNTAPSYLMTFNITDSSNNTAEFSCFVTTSSNTKGIKINLPNGKSAFFKIEDTDKIEKVLSTLITPSKNGMSSKIDKITTMNKTKLIDVLTGEVIENPNNAKDSYSKIDIQYSFKGVTDSKNIIKMYFNHGSNKNINLPGDFSIESNIFNQELINNRICGITTNSVLDSYIISICNIELFDNTIIEDDFDIEDL